MHAARVTIRLYDGGVLRLFSDGGILRACTLYDSVQAIGYHRNKLSPKGASF